PASFGVPGGAARGRLRDAPPERLDPPLPAAPGRRQSQRRDPPRHCLMPLLERYEQALREEARAADPAQHAVARRLDALDRCLSATPAAARWRRRLAALAGRETYPATCRGIYL